jgi:predicted nucleic acid-binding protein
LSIYLDSAYVAKCYINEPDATSVRKLVKGESDLHTSALCLAELACIFQRHIREKGLSRSQALALRESFLEDVEGGAWTLLPISDSVLRNVEASVRNLPRGLYLRAGDAIHLVSARDAGFSEIWSNDRHLLGAASSFGLRGKSVKP